MNALKFYKISTWVLLLVNVAMITFFLVTRNGPHNRGKGNVIKKAKEVMDLNRDQNDKFLEFANAHKAEMEILNINQKQKLNAYFQIENKDNEVNNSADLMYDILSLEEQKIESTYNHFEDIKEMLNPDQHAGFEEFKQGALSFILLNEKNNAPPPKD